MEQTEIENLIKRYLPHNLKVQILNYKQDYTGVKDSVLDGFYSLDGTAHFTYEKGNTGKSIKEFKPYLKPMSQFLEEDLDYLYEHYSTDYFSDSTLDPSSLIFHITRNNFYVQMEFFPLGLIDWLLAMHYDIGGLIEKGLAIDLKEYEQ